MSEQLASQVQTFCDIVLAHLSGDDFATHLLSTADYRQQINRIKKSFEEVDLSESEAAFGQNEGIQLIVRRGSDEANSSLREIRRWLKGAKRITFCDPYFLQSPRSAAYRHEQAYVDALIDLIPQSATHVDVICEGFKQSIRTSFVNCAKERCVTRIYFSGDVHDRFVVRDGTAKAIGTSFGGFGNKIFAVMDLDQADTEIVVSAFNEIRR